MIKKLKILMAAGLAVMLLIRGINALMHIDEIREYYSGAGFWVCMAFMPYALIITEITALFLKKAPSVIMSLLTLGAGLIVLAFEALFSFTKIMSGMSTEGTGFSLPSDIFLCVISVGVILLKLFESKPYRSGS